MKNVLLEVKNDTLTITIDLKKSFGPSKSGKTIIVASTEGNVPVQGSEFVTLGLNAYKPR